MREPTRKVRERADRMLGQPFLRLPGNPPNHKVMGVASDGTRIRVDVIEMVINDALLMDALSGDPGRYRREALPLEAEAYDLGIKLYGDSIATFGMLCQYCRCELWKGEHQQGCEALVRRLLHLKKPHLLS